MIRLISNKISIAFILLLALPLNLLAGPKDNQIILIFSGDNNGLVESCNCPPEPWGGLAYRKTVIDSLKRSGQCDILADYGNFLSSYKQEKSDLLVGRIYSILGYDVVNTGKNDFLYGIEFLRKLRDYNIPLISSNIKTGSPGSKIIKINGKKILFAGLCGKLKNIPDSKFTSPVSALREILQKGKEYDCLIILSCLSEDENRNLVDKFPGKINIILGSGSEESIRGGYRYYKKVLFAIAGTEGRTLGKIEIKFSMKQKPEYSISFIPVPLNIEPDPDVEKLIKSE